MTGKHLPLILVLALGLSEQALAAADVEVRVYVEGAGAAIYQANSEDDPAFDSAVIASGRAYGDAAGGSASVAPLKSECGPPGESTCAMQGVDGGSGFTRAEANAVAGSLRAFARASSDPDSGLKHAAASASLTDTISYLAPPVVNFDLDLSSTLIGEGSSSLTFTFGLRNFDLAPCEDFGQCGFVDTILARLLISEDRDTSEGIDRDISTLTIEGMVVESNDFILEHYQFSYDLGQYVASGAGSVDIFAELFVAASAGEDSIENPQSFTSVARMAADQSAYLQIDNVTSANGSSYLGRPAPVPLPAPLALLAFGLASLGAVGRRRQG